jgi:uncharacterized membrane protein YfcA
MKGRPRECAAMIFSAIVIGSALVTSILSGVLGMAGGMILMAILVAVTSVSGAMIIHGAVQGMANGSRAIFLRRHIAWQILPPYLVGAAAALGAFVALRFVPDAAWVLIVIGGFPWLARVTPRLHGLDVTRAPTACVCGVVVTAAQLFAGASGPLLDVFYLNAKLTRQQIVASKALTQTLGHVLKLVYYGGILSAGGDVPVALTAAAMATAVVGTRIGTRLLERFDDAGFRRASGWAILAIGAYCIVKGILDLMG